MNAPQSLAALIAELHTIEPELPPEVREQILASGEAAIPTLMALMEQENPELEGDEIELEPDLFTLHAISLLIELKVTSVIDPLLRRLNQPYTDETLHMFIREALPRLGQPVLEPALKAMEQQLTKEGYIGVCDILASLGIQDERIYALLVDLFERGWPGGASFLGTYGDLRALPLLTNQIRAQQRDGDYESCPYDLLVLEAAYQDLAGEVPPDLRAEAGMLGLVSPPERSPVTQILAPPRVGRNDPCPCGSGRKYKKCCQN